MSLLWPGFIVNVFLMFLKKNRPDICEPFVCSKNRLFEFSKVCAIMSKVN